MRTPVSTTFKCRQRNASSSLFLMEGERKMRAHAGCLEPLQRKDEKRVLQPGVRSTEGPGTANTSEKDDIEGSPVKLKVTPTPHPKTNQAECARNIFEDIGVRRVSCESVSRPVKGLARAPSITKSKLNKPKQSNRKMLLLPAPISQCVYWMMSLPVLPEGRRLLGFWDQN